MHVEIWEGKSDKSQAKLRDYESDDDARLQTIVGSEDFFVLREYNSLAAIDGLPNG